MPQPERLAMLAELAALTGKTRDVAFALVIEQAEYQEFTTNNPGIVKDTGSPYTIALVSILEAAATIFPRNIRRKKYTIGLRQEPKMRQKPSNLCAG
jgi:hypothetical protein